MGARARGTESRRYPWGNADPTRDDELYYTGITLPVGARPKADTPEGLRDMGGNVWEWTSSPACMHDEPGCKSNDRVAKGGANTNVAAVAGANRFFHPPATRLYYLGFRCARSIDPAESR